ncbi:MAG TPA: LytTR family DNA-binding domain-containing protein [Bacteroidales bacterium]|nr:response regulator transcription factor [Bacteroidales bacterium]HCI55861.1 DNA-binding response regulator [Bacteroidales bacterium]HOU96562.1 LytTR family DNA-binding domain-containing protein [Bacteroidales bacterium]HQJ21269.1 LytTR family DNA-binding domain-containing protein [Bacteroidales bacterium]HRC88749.1 LytTR family DNA-binding domain-containing protein [Bacteroidales bacterium]
MLSVITIDDEPLALKLISEYIEKTPGLKLSGSFDNPLDAIEYLSEKMADIIFVDIQMPDLTGIEFTRLIEKSPKVIFTTAYEQYALEGYKLEITDYLLKPFSYEEFLTAVNKAVKQINLERKAMKGLEANDEFLFLKSDYKIKRINFNDILYIEGLKDYIKVYVENLPHPILSLSTMKLAESKLPGEKFMRVHKSFIVNLDKINTIERCRIVFGKTYIPIGEQYKEKFQKYLDSNFL